MQDRAYGLRRNRWLPRRSFDSIPWLATILLSRLLAPRFCYAHLGPFWSREVGIAWAEPGSKGALDRSRGALGALIAGMVLF